jgi:hypothetical protein
VWDGNYESYGNDAKDDDFMKMSTRVIGGGEFDRKMAKLAEGLGRELPSLVRQAARAGAQNFGFYTAPYGFDEPERFRAKIESDVRRVFATREDASAVYLLLRAVDPQKAEAYWAAHKKGSKRRAADILNSVSIPRGADLSVLKAARSSRRGHVPPKIQPRALATKTELNALVRKQMKLAGFAKAGWYQAGRGLGGRIRTNVVDAATGKRSTRETFPAFIRKLANANGGIGGARMGSDAFSAFAEIFTNVNHAVDALPKGQQARAAAMAQEAFDAACVEALRVVRSRVFRRAS